MFVVRKENFQSINAFYIIYSWGMHMMKLYKRQFNISILSLVCLHTYTEQSRNCSVLVFLNIIENSSWSAVVEGNE